MNIKKKVMIVIAAVLANIAALTAIFVHFDKKQAAADASKTTAATPKTTAAAPKATADSTHHKTDSAAVKAHGIVGKFIQDIKKEQAAIKKRIDKDKELMLKGDSLQVKTSFRKAHRDSMKTIKEKIAKKKPLNPKGNIEKVLKDLKKHQKNAREKTLEEAWDSVHKIAHTIDSKLHHKFIRNDTVKVFGWHPYWMGTAYKSYNFSLLSTVAYFSYELDPHTGKYRDIHDWSTTPLRDSVREHDCDLVLTVSCFGRDIHTFLSSRKAQDSLFHTLNAIVVLNERGDGVNLDFEGLQKGDSKAFTSFIKNMHAYFVKKDPAFKISIAIPAVDWNSAYDVKELAKIVDCFIIMGYDYYGGWSETAGPVSPLRSGTRWLQYNLDRTVNEYKEQAPSSKLLLGLPYYGAEWTTVSGEIPSNQKKFTGHKLYKDIQKSLGKLTHVQLDSTSVTAYNASVRKGNYTQLWYDNAATLEHKIEWVKEKKLGGIGIWALGYDHGTTDLWEVLRDECSIEGIKNDARPIVIKDDARPIVIKDVPPAYIIPADTVHHYHKAGSGSLALKGYALVLADGTYYALEDEKILLLAIAGSFFIVLLLQIILDATPWKDSYLKRLIMYAISAALITGLLAFLAIGHYVSGTSSYLMLIAGLLAGYFMARLAAWFIKRGGEDIP